MRRSSLVLFATFACGRSAPPPDATATVPAQEPPVALNAEPAVQYPSDLYARGIEGDVVLRLYVDSTGRLAPESTRVAESSKWAALDSAAVRGVRQLRYAPARRRGRPVSTMFLQTVQFRRPGAAQTAPPERARPRPAPSRPPRADSSPVRRARVPTTADTTPPRASSASRADTAAPPVPQKPAVDSGAADSSRARPDSNGAAR